MYRHKTLERREYDTVGYSQITMSGTTKAVRNINFLSRGHKTLEQPRKRTTEFCCADFVEED